MGRFLSAVVIAVALASCGMLVPQGGPKTYDSRTPAEQNDAAVTVYHCAGRTYGSGVVLDADRILTAYHVVDGCVGWPIGIAGDGKRYLTSLVAVYPIHDIAVLERKRRRDGPGRVSIRPSKIGQSICQVPRKKQPVRRCGNVEKWVDLPRDAKHSAITEPGNSGAGVYSKAGFLVGITTHYRQRLSTKEYVGGYFTRLYKLIR